MAPSSVISNRAWTLVFTHIFALRRFISIIISAAILLERTPISPSAKESAWNIVVMPHAASFLSSSKRAMFTGKWLFGLGSISFSMASLCRSIKPGRIYPPCALILMPPEFIFPSLIFEIMPSSILIDVLSAIPEGKTNAAFSITKSLPDIANLLIYSVHPVCNGPHQFIVMEYAYH